MSKCLTSKWNELPEILYISSYIFNDLIWTCSPEELPKPNSKCNSNMHEHALQTYLNEVNSHSAKQLVFKWTSQMLRSPWGDMVMKTIWDEKKHYCNAFAFLQEYLGFAYKTMTFSSRNCVNAKASKYNFYSHLMEFPSPIILSVCKSKYQMLKNGSIHTKRNMQDKILKLKCISMNLFTPTLTSLLKVHDYFINCVGYLSDLV